MFEQAFKNIDNTLRKEAGCATELDYIEQTSWILFLKYLDDFEREKKTHAELAGQVTSQLSRRSFDGEIGRLREMLMKTYHHAALTGDDLTDFVDQKLFPYLKKFKASATSADTIGF